MPEKTCERARDEMDEWLGTLPGWMANADDILEYMIGERHFTVEMLFPDLHAQHEEEREAAWSEGTMGRPFPK